MNKSFNRILSENESLEEQFSHIPLPSIFKLRSAVERFGAAHQILKLSQNLRPYLPRSFAYWQHGWFFWPVKYSEGLFAFEVSSKRDYSFIVSSEYLYQLLIKEDYLYPQKAPLPFYFTETLKPNRIKNSLLAMPPHSAERERIESLKLIKLYLDYLVSIKSDFETIYVCLFSLDASPELCNEITKRGLFWVIGGWPDDQNSLQRLRYLFETFEYVSLSCMSSAFIYALYCNCKVSICGPYITEYSIQSSERNQIVVDELFRFHEYTKFKYKNFFLKHPAEGVQNYSHALDEISPKTNEDPKDIARLLGWNYPERGMLYLNGLKRRIHRSIFLS
tara:strand:- start:2952 stop:3953 length:1002 start_codon:yes stop_codon:yes gene_type:complete